MDFDVWANASTTKLNILALEPFYGGSHKAFLDGWSQYSKHKLTVLGLPAYKWKWRMRHAAVTFAKQLASEPYTDQSWDAVFASDMLNLAEFIGLVPPHIQQLPKTVYFHENQLTYPVQVESERDLHFAFSNFTTAIAADKIVFNSDFHRDDFLGALATYLKRMPDYAPVSEVEVIQSKSFVESPGVDPFPLRTSRPRSPLRICWNARWEHDKNPEDFFAAMRLLREKHVQFRLLVLGEQFRNSPEVFTSARGEFAPEIEHWGYAESHDEYRRVLSTADVVVSTAHHEFFGIGIVEAMAAGAIPLVPNRLAYPSLMSRIGLPTEASQTTAEYPIRMVYDGTVDDLVNCLQQLASSLDPQRDTSSVKSRYVDTNPNSVGEASQLLSQSRNIQLATKPLHWQRRAIQLDAVVG